MIARIDAALGRMPMYRFVVLSLAALAACAFAASFTGALYFTPAELGARLAIVVGVTLLVSRVAAKLWRTDTHDESSLVTALLLFFIMKPSLEPGDLLAAALAAAVAGLSKFLIAWRGKHLFNPAAFGAFVVVTAGIGAGYWWIGSSTLIWAVLPIALLLVLRLRQWLMPTIATLEPGAMIRATGVTGNFAPPRDERRRLLMIASGVGVTPFISWLRELRAQGESRAQGTERDAVLILATNDPEHSHFREELAGLPARVIFASAAEPTRLDPHESWAGPERLTGDRIAELVPDVAERDVSISGAPEFVAARRRELRRHTRRTRSDVFAGY